MATHNLSQTQAYKFGGPREKLTFWALVCPSDGGALFLSLSPHLFVFIFYIFKWLNIFNSLISSSHFNLTCKNFKVNEGVKVTSYLLNQRFHGLACMRKNDLLACELHNIKIWPTYFSTSIQGHIKQVTTLGKHTSCIRTPKFSSGALTSTITVIF